MQLTTMQLERRQRLECYKFIKRHKPTLSFYLQRYYLPSHDKSYWINRLQSPSPKFPAIDGIGTSASKTRGHNLAGICCMTRARALQVYGSRGLFNIGCTVLGSDRNPLCYAYCYVLTYPYVYWGVTTIVVY